MNSKLNIFFLIIIFSIGINGEFTKILNSTITWINHGDKTDFRIESPISQNSDYWLGIGLNKEPQMNGANVIVCRYSPGKKFIRHYYAENYQIKLIDESSPSIGLSNVQQSRNQTFVSCSFTRLNEASNKMYFNIEKNPRPYLIYSFGFGEIGYHGTNRGISKERVNFSPQSL